ncbi:MAG: 4Fe-4S binding protein [Campylobacterales bacterium]|nr:4Fe-4S binding protein [Campylobacterales bacterium]
MAVIITDLCINCDECLQNCPVNAIVYDAHFLNEDLYKLCNKENIVKFSLKKEKKYRKDILLSMCGVGKEVQVEL